MTFRKRFQSLLIFILLLSLPALACNVLGGEEELTEVPATEAPVEEAPAEEEAVEPTATAEPEEPTATAELEEPTELPEPAGDAPDLRALSDLGATLEDFNSYRVAVNMRFTGQGADAQEGGVDIETAVIAEPPASRTTISMRGQMVAEADGMDSLSVAEIGDQVYMVLPGMGCVSGSGEEMGGATDQFSDIFDTEELLGEIGDAEFVGEETVNGVDVYHYRFDESDVDDSDSEMRELDGHVYVAVDGNYVVSMVVDGVGTMDLFDEGTEEEGNIHLEYNVTDVGGDFEIEIPEGCEEVGSEFPVMEDAANVASFAGFTSYETEASVADVIAFYEEEMAALGYETSPDQFTSEDTAIMTFSQEGRPDVTVTASEDAGITSVLITGETEDG